MTFRSRSSAGRHEALAARLFVALMTTTSAACALKAPPDAAAIKAEAMPTMQAPPQWTAAGAGAGAVSDNWLASFHDEGLTAAIAEAIAHNADLRVGAARVEQAQLHARLAGAKLYPSVDLLARGGGKLSGDGSGIQGGVLSATWEIDLWGRVRYGRAAAAAQAVSAQADFEYARQSIAALVARSWFLAVEAGLQADAARETIRGSESLVHLADERARIGVGNQADVSMARAGVGGYRDALRQLELGRDQAVRALEILLGRYPSGATKPATQLPASPPAVPAGLPSELLERRPDVIAAERRVAAAFHRIQEAKAARLPAIALTTGISAISSELFLLKDHDNPVWNLGANLLAPLYRGGALKTQVSIRTAEQKQAIAEYAAVGLRAFGEVESALAAEIAAREREQILAQTLTDNEQALTIVQAQFKVGSADLRFVEQRQLALTAARSALIRVQTEQRVQRVNLHLALGGSFELRPPAAAPSPAGSETSEGRKGGSADR
jgi:outer membrane protein, multidrug efflux system